jgi:hypothetical protein
MGDKEANDRHIWWLGWSVCPPSNQGQIAAAAWAAFPSEETRIPLGEDIA